MQESYWLCKCISNNSPVVICLSNYKLIQKWKLQLLEIKKSRNYNSGPATKIRWMKEKRRLLTLKMKDEVDTVTGFLDMPPYVTIVPPCLETNTLHLEVNLRPCYWKDGE